MTQKYYAVVINGEIALYDDFPEVWLSKDAIKSRSVYAGRRDIKIEEVTIRIVKPAVKKKAIKNGAAKK